MLTRKLTLLFITLLLSVAAPTWAADAAKTTRKVVSKSLQEMREAWTNFPSKSQDQVRAAFLQDLTAKFAKDIAAAEIPANETLQKTFNAYLDNLDRGYEVLALTTMKSELNNYIKNCTAAFKREALASSDYAKERTTQDCFLLLIHYFEEVKERFPKKDYAAARQEVISAIQPLVTGMLQNAKVPEKGLSASEQHEENNKFLRLKFPTTPVILAEMNQPFKSACENFAKQVQAKAARR